MRRRPLKFLGISLLAVGGLIGLAGCESELPPPPRRPGDRAVADPLVVNSSDYEVLAPQPDAVPLLEVDLSNKKDEPAKVKTIFDALHPPAATQPVATPPPALPARPMRGSFDTSVSTQP
jgi:hypothetical protein